MKSLTRTQFGNPILRKQARQLSLKEIQSPATQQLIKEMRHTLVSKKLGIGLAAPQVGKSIALAVIAIRPTPHRPKVKSYDLVLINPVITNHSEKKLSLWEGCISAGSNGRADLFAKVPRYAHIKVKFIDENGERQIKSFRGLKAQVIQHEVDHLQGLLFVDHVEEPKTFMTYDEYMKRVRHISKKDN